MGYVANLLTDGPPLIPPPTLKLGGPGLSLCSESSDGVGAVDSIGDANTWWCCVAVWLRKHRGQERQRARADTE